MIRIAGVFAAMGIVISLVLLVAWKASSGAGIWAISDAVARVMPIAWPASLWLMAVHPGSTVAEIVGLYIIVVLANGAVYCAIGVILGGVVRLARHRT